MQDSGSTDHAVYKVVVNDEEQYSIWPLHRPNPPGWHDTEQRGIQADCLEYIATVWTDMRPRSLRTSTQAAVQVPGGGSPA